MRKKRNGECKNIDCQNQAGDAFTVNKTRYCSRDCMEQAIRRETNQLVNASLDQANDPIDDEGDDW